MSMNVKFYTQHIFYLLDKNEAKKQFNPEKVPTIERMISIAEDNKFQLCICRQDKIIAVQEHGVWNKEKFQTIFNTGIYDGYKPEVGNYIQGNWVQITLGKLVTSENT